jgi:pimeloyl-ACP methyl ester carboxylesterase
MSEDRAESESIVLVNGLWLGNAALWPLAARLRRLGFRAVPFSYPSVRQNLRANADRLQQFLAGVPGETVHWVGYSLGGVVIRALFRFYPEQRPGRIVLIGSPQQGNRVAEVLEQRRWGRRLAGHSVAELVSGITRTWAWPARATGVIAGNRPIGLGRLITSLPVPNDGTVTVNETVLPEADDRLELPLAHSALLLSPLVAQQVATFLATGRFVHQPLPTA